MVDITFVSFYKPLNYSNYASTYDSVWYRDCILLCDCISLWCRKVSICSSIKTKQPKKAKPASLHRNDVPSSIILIALCWTLPSMSMSLSYWGAQNRPQDSSVASTSAVQLFREEGSPPSTCWHHPLMEPGTSLAFFTASTSLAHGQLGVHQDLQIFFCQLLSTWWLALCMLVSGLVLFQFSCSASLSFVTSENLKCFLMMQTNVVVSAHNGL